LAEVAILNDAGKLTLIRANLRANGARQGARDRVHASLRASDQRARAGRPCFVKIGTLRVAAGWTEGRGKVGGRTIL